MPTIPVGSASGLVIPKIAPEGAVNQRWRHIEFFTQAVKLNASIGFPVNQNYELAGTNAADANSGFDADGGNSLVTAGAANDQMVIQAHKDAGQSAINAIAWQAQKYWRFETRVLLGSVITSAIVWAGMKLVETSAANDANQAMFRYQDGVNGGRWQLITVNAGVPNTLDSGIVAAAADEVWLAVDVVYNTADNTFVPQYFIGRNYGDLQFVGQGASLLTATSLLPVVAVQGTAASPRSLTVRHIGTSIQRFIS